MNPSPREDPNYLTVPSSRSTSSASSAPTSSRSPTPSSYRNSRLQFPIHPVIESQSEFFTRTYVKPDSSDAESDASMSHYSSPSDYVYQTGSSSRQPKSFTEIYQIRQSLKHHRVNTLTELRRIENTLSSLPDFVAEHMDDMSAAWNFYVGNNFLHELRGLTRRYPFSAELLEDAKSRVYADPNSGRSWNLAWLLLVKIEKEQMVAEYANRTAQQPAMWGGVLPSENDVAHLANVLTREWAKAVEQMLRHFQNAPVLGGGGSW